MNDDKEHTMQGGVDWELRQAEAAMVAAPDGTPALARAMRLHADGVRNMMQAELVPSFLNAIERMLTKNTQELTDQIGGLRGETIALQAEFQTRIGRLETADVEKLERLKNIEVAQERFQLALDLIGRDVLLNELHRVDRLENVAFIGFLKQLYPDLAERARRTALDQGG